MSRGGSSTRGGRFQDKGDKGVKGLDALKEKYAVKDPVLMSTGILIFDTLLGGGIPKGSFIELASESGLGKSTLMASVARFMAMSGLKVQWWDYEHALTDGLKEGLGLMAVPEGNFIHLEPTTYGDGEEILEGLSDDEVPDIIIVDSETGMLPDKLVGDSILSMEPGVKSRISSSFLQKYKGWARKKQMSIVFINQMRVKMGDRFSQVSVDSAGGNALKFYCDIRLRMRKGLDLTREEDTPEGKKKVIYGVEAIMWAVKNREARSHVELTLPIIFGRGVSNLMILKTILITAGCVVSAGSYFKINIEGVHEGTVQGNKGLFDVLKNYRKEIEAYIKDKDLLFLSREIEK